MVDSADQTSTDSKNDKFLEKMRFRLDRSVENESDERERAEEDINFINGEQWDSDVVRQRGKGRLCLTINKLPVFLDQIDGDIRLSTPGLKVKAVDNDADPDTADVIEGLVRYTQRQSSADKVHAYAGVHAATGGRGAWRVLTEYVSDNGFDQFIRVKRIINAYSVYFDPAAEEDDKQDGQYMFLVTDMSKEAYKEAYDHEPVDFTEDGSKFSNWQSDNSVRVAEYFYKEKVGSRTLYLLEDGTVTEEKPKSGVVRTRVAPIYKIKWAKVDGKRVLDTEDVPGNMFPIVLTWGKQLCVKGKLEARGIARHAKDAARLYNYFRSNDAEAAALQPKQPYLMPDVCLGPYKNVWDKSTDENYPYLPFKIDPTNPNLRPTREPPAMVSSANQAQAMIADNELRDTVGIQKAALGMESNEQSGVAIQRRKQESDTGQYAYLDNLSSAIKTEGKIILGMLPEVYSTEAQIRILGPDMKEKVVGINDGQGIDLTTGQYDIDISTEASYSTQREEFQDKLKVMLPVIPPEQVAVISDILFEMQDFPRADDIAERLKKLIPPDLLEKDEGGEETIEEVPEEMQEVPDPAMEAEYQIKQAELEEKQIKLEQEQAKLEGLRIKNELAIKAEKEDIAQLVRETMEG